MPEWISRLRVEGIRLGESNLLVDVDAGQVEIRLDAGLEVIRRPREPLTATTG